MSTNIRIVELSPDQFAMIGAGILTMYYNYEGDCVTTDKPDELLDAAIVLEECVIVLKERFPQLSLHFTRVADMMRHAIAYIRKLDQGS